MAMPDDVIFLLDVDNTLLDHDLFHKNLMMHLERAFGAHSSRHYAAILEQLRAELGYVDYLGAMQRYRLANMGDPGLLSMSGFLLDYPFAGLLYPGVEETISHLSRIGRTVILSDGDAIFQPRKIDRSGLARMVEHRVLIYIHKERMLDHVAQHYPARRYVMIDDKLRVLAAMKAIWERRLTTVFVRQGHYALDTDNDARYGPADSSVARVGELAEHEFLWH